MSIWQWIYNRRYDAMINRDETTLEMVNQFWNMLDMMHDNPELSLQFAARAKQLAQLKQDKWFEQLINHWELQTRYSYLGDYTGTLDLAIKSTVEVRLPDYQSFPQRICLHEDLISGYVQQDPIGNKALVQQALDYMEREVDPSVECFMCLNLLKLDFVRTTSTIEETLKTAQIALQVVESVDFHLSNVYIVLTEIAYQQQKWDDLLKWAIEAESHSRKSERENLVITSLLWLALHAERTQKLDQAQNLFQQATHRTKRYGAFIGKAYYNALTAYHETAGRLQEALHAQQDYLSRVVGKSKPFSESLTYLQIIRLKKALHQSVDDDILALKETVKALKAPDYILDQLKDM